MDKCEYCNAGRPAVGVLRVCCEEGAAADYQPMTPDKVEAALGVLRSVANVRKWWLTDWLEGGGSDSPKSALSNFTDASNGIEEALATLTSALAERERDAARYRWLRRDLAISAVPRVWASNEDAEPTECLHMSRLDAAIDTVMKDTDHAR